jgi:RNA polymerase sigma-70 factor (ECF subfamily)
VRPVRLASLSLVTTCKAVEGLPEQDGPLENAKLVAGVRAGDPEALALLHQRFARPVLHILLRILGPDHELEDMHHDVFVRALGSLSQLRDPGALRGFMSAIAVHTARAGLERRIRRRRWVFLSPSESLPEPEPVDPGPGHEARAAVRAAYRVLACLPVPERIAFTLRYFEQMELSQVAQACNVSLASIKRRLARAEARFWTIARRTPELADYVEGGSR